MPTVAEDTWRGDPAYHQQRGKAKEEIYNWQPLDAPGTFLWIHKNDLLFDESYQRVDEISDTKVKSIARDFSWQDFIAIGVCRRSDGRYYVYEGMHRVMGARQRSDITNLPCIVFAADDPITEARAFLGANKNRKPISGTASFKAEVTAQDEAALFVADLVASVGREVSKSSGAGKVKCVRTLKRWAIRVPDVLRRMFPLIHQVCGSHPIHSDIVDGLLLIETRMPDGQSLTNAKWRHRVLRAGYDGLLNGAAAARAYHKRGGEKVIAEGMVRELNYKCKNRLSIPGLSDT